MISILCPSRGRPEQFKRTYESAKANAEGDIEIYAFLDEDDPSIKDYPPLSADRPFVTVLGERRALGPAYQWLWQLTRAPIVMMCADDIVFRTKGWDTKVKEAMPKDLVGVVACNELETTKKEYGHPFIGRKLIELMGYICHPKLKHSCVDNWVRDVSQPVGRFIYLPDVIIEHMHPKYKKGTLDNTYLSNNVEIRDADGRVYRRATNEIAQTIMRVKQYLNENKLVHRLG